MKNNMIIKLLPVLILAIISGSCGKDFISITPKGQFLTENYYSNRDEAYTGLVAVYDVLRKNAGGFESMLSLLNSGSDDHYAGGGGPTDGNQLQVFSNFTINPNTVAESYWNDHYQGVARANILLSKLPDVPMDESEKARFTAETKVLRGIYYFNLVRLFRNIPLMVEPLAPADMYKVTQADPADVYAQIEKDISEAIGDLPPTINLASEAGRLTKGAAQAMLGKVYLYDNKNAQAATVLSEVNGTTPGQPNQYGNYLLPNFADLWVFTNKFNAEGIITCRHTDQSNADWGFWGSSSDEGNTINQMVGPRSYQKTGDNAPDIYPSGWSFNVWTNDFIDAIKDDPRYPATVLDMNALTAAGEATYLAGYMNTGYFLNKFIPRVSDERTGAGAVELNFQQDDYIIRLADCYLMEAEALGATGSRAQALLDAVRARVGLPSIPVTMEAIKRERRLELAGEGQRFFDLVRWGDAASKLGDRGFVAGKNEILPIPARELRGTQLQQNPIY